MRNRSNAILLIVIRWQPMIVRTYKGLEERPGLSGKLPEEDKLISPQPCPAAGERPAEPPRDNRGGEPEAQHRPGNS